MKVFRNKILLVSSLHTWVVEVLAVPPCDMPIAFYGLTVSLFVFPFHFSILYSSTVVMDLDPKISASVFLFMLYPLASYFVLHEC